MYSEPCNDFSPWMETQVMLGQAVPLQFGYTTTFLFAGEEE